MSFTLNRHNHQPRSALIELSLLARADGSARFTFSSSGKDLSGPSALSSVSGPIEARLSLENPSQATLEVHVRPLSHVPGTEAKACAMVLKKLMESSILLSVNPRTVIQIVAQAMSQGGGSKRRGMGDGLIAAIINASTLALLNAGSIPMRGVVCAVAVGRTRDGVLIVDPEDEDVIAVHGCFAFMFDGAIDSDLAGQLKKLLKGRCVWTNWMAETADEGRFEDASLAEAKVLAEEAASIVYSQMLRSLSGAKGTAESGEGSEKGERDSHMEL